MGAFRTREFTPVPPGERPRRSRVGVRVIVTDGEDVLLLRDTDPGIPGSAWYVTPGGGVDPGETLRETAVRELQEETGLVVAASALVGPVMTRVAVHGYSDQVLAQDETFFVLVTPRFEPDTSGHTPDEQVTLQGHDWVPLSGLACSSLPVWPAAVAELVELASRVDFEVWDAGVVEESTVAVAWSPGADPGL